MEKDFFEKNYPQLTQLYNEYINRKEYAKQPIVEYTEPLTSKAINDSVDLLKQGKEIQACDNLTLCAVTYEQSGFIQGFSLAMSLMQESTSIKGGAI